MPWCLKGSGKFDTQTFYKEIWDANISPFPWKSIWTVKIPNRVAFFVWTAALGRILTLDNFSEGLPLVNWNCMCQRNGENSGPPLT